SPWRSTADAPWAATSASSSPRPRPRELSTRWAWTTTSATPRREATAAAHRTATWLSSDLSNPTTTFPAASTTACLLQYGMGAGVAVSPRTLSDHHAHAPAFAAGRPRGLLRNRLGSAGRLLR